MNTKMTLEKRILSALLTVVLAFSMMPLSVFAADDSVAEVTVGGTTTPYSDLARAFNAVQYASGSVTVKLLDNVDNFYTGFNKSDGVQFNSGDVTFDLNGHYLLRYNNAAGINANKKAVFYVTGSAKLTVMDSVGGGEIMQPLSEPALIVDSGASLTVLSGTITNTGAGYGIRIDGGTLTVEGGTIKSAFDTGICVGGGTVTVTGDAKIHSEKYNALLITGESSVTLSGGTYTTNGTNKSSILTNVGKVTDLLADGFRYADANGLDIAITEDGQGTDSAHVTVSDFGIKYIDADGAEQKCTSFTELTDAATGDLSGWYAVTGTANIEGAIGVTGGNTLNLILCDGAELSLTHTLYMLGGSTLNIYGQSDGTGTLIVESSICQPAIGIMAGFSGGTVTVNIYGGTVTAKVTEGAQPIGLVPSVTAGKVTVTIAKGMKCVKTDDQNTAYAYNNTDGTSITITKCTEHTWSYTEITNDTHNQTCDLCGTAETGVAHTTAGYKYIRTDIHRLICACGKDYSTEYHTYTYAPNSDGLTHTATCKCAYAVDDIAHTYKGEDEACICGAVHSATYDGKNYASLQSAVDAAAPVGGTVTLAQQVNENVVVTDGTVTIDLGGNRWSADISYSKKGYVPLTVNGGSVTLKNGNLFQGSSTSTYETGIVINGGSVTVEEDARVRGGVPDRDSLCPSITLNGGALMLKEGAALLSGLTVPEGKVLADYLSEGTAFVKCSYDNNSNIVTVSDPQEFVPDVYTASKNTGGMAVVSHTHDFSNDANTCVCGLTCLHDSGNDREASYFEKAICSVCHCEYGDYVQDTTAPTGEIKIKDLTWWKKLLNTISFGLFYKETVTVEITATDDSYTQSGYDKTKHAVKIEYLISTEPLSEEVVKKSAFNAYDGSFDISDDDQYVIYAKLTDHAGNVAYASTDGFVIDTTPPVIEGYENGETVNVCGSLTLTFVDANLDKATQYVEDWPYGDPDFLLPLIDGKYTLYPTDTYVIKATDKAGNVTTVTFNVAKEHDFDPETKKCRHCGQNALVEQTIDGATTLYDSFDSAIDAMPKASEYESAEHKLLGDLTGNVINSWSYGKRVINLNGHTFNFTFGGFAAIETVDMFLVGGGTMDGNFYVQNDGALTVDLGDGKLKKLTQNSGTLKVVSGTVDTLEVSYNEYGDHGTIRETALCGGHYGEIKIVDIDGLTCADLLEESYCFEGLTLEQAKVTELNNVTVDLCYHERRDQNYFCPDCGIQFVAAVKIGNVETLFDTFERAISYAEKNAGCTVKFLQDITLSRANIGSWIYNYYINLATGTYTLDLAGKALTIGDGGEALQGLTVTGGCDLTVTDTVGGGKIKSSRWGEVFEVRSDGHLTIERGDYTELSRALANGPDSLTIKGGKFKCVSSREDRNSVSPLTYLADGCAFMMYKKDKYANESNVDSQYISGSGTQYWIKDVSVVPAPQTIDEQPTDLKFYLTSMAADKYVKLVVSTIEQWQGKQFRMSLEKADGTVIQENAVTAFEKQEITLSAVNFTASDSGSYRVKLEINGYVLYSDTFSITVAVCEHPGYDETTHKCTQCGCDLAAAVVKDGKTTGYVIFADALAAAQTDENKGCVLWLLADVTGKVAVSGGDFKLGLNGYTVDVLNVTKTAKLNVFGGTVNGNVIVAKTASLTASALNFMGTVGDNGSNSTFIDCVFAQALNARGSYTNLNNCTINGALNVSGNKVTLTASTVYGKTTVNNGGLLRFMGNGGKYGETLVKSGGTLEVYSNNTVSGKLTAASGSKMTLSGGVYTEVAVADGADLTVSGGQFTKITVAGKKLIDYLAEGKAFEDMNNGFIIDGRVGIAGDVRVVSHTHTCVWKTNTHEKLCGCGFVEAVDADAPVISGIANGQTYYGAVEFSVTDANDFTVTVDGKAVQLTLGSYILMPDNESHTVIATDAAGNTASVTVCVNQLYKVTLRSGAGYTLSGEALAGYGTDYTFTLTIAEGYSKTDNFMVDVNGAPMRSDSGSYTVPTVTSDLVITVFGIADTTPPSAEITVGTNKFRSFLHTITFGLFFKETQTVQVTAADTGSGIKKAEYLLSETAFEDKDAITGNWIELTLAEGRASFNIVPNQKAYVYVRVTDQSDNITVVNSDGVVVYTDAEAITETMHFTRLDGTDVSFEVRLNGNTVNALYNGTTLIDSADYTVSADGTIALKNRYLSTLAADEYTIRVRYSPRGKS